jgi:hypothetical protein
MKTSPERAMRRSLSSVSFTNSLSGFASLTAMTFRTMQKFQGSCHCGAVRFEIETDFPELTTCDCSICKKKNALMVKVHESKFRLIAGEEALTEYQFHTKTARHYFCKVCGIYPFHRKRVTPDNLGINVNCLDGADLEGVPVRRAVGAAMP